MTETWFQLVGLLTAGAVVLMGARWELRSQPWGETAWRVMLALFVGAAVIAVAFLVMRGAPPRPSALTDAGLCPGCERAPLRA